PDGPVRIIAIISLSLYTVPVGTRSGTRGGRRDAVGRRTETLASTCRPAGMMLLTGHRVSSWERFRGAHHGRPNRTREAQHVRDSRPHPAEAGWDPGTPRHEPRVRPRTRQAGERVRRRLHIRV